jgi:hypothetical protein
MSAANVPPQTATAQDLVATANDSSARARLEEKIGLPLTRQLLAALVPVHRRRDTPSP